MKPLAVPAPKLTLPFVDNQTREAAAIPITPSNITSSSRQTHEVTSCSSTVETSTATMLNVAISKRNSLTGYVKTLSSTEMEELHILLGRAIYTSGAPFSIVDNLHWVTFLHRLNPAYKLPSRHLLANKILEQEDKAVTQSVNEHLQAAGLKSLTLTLDGWTDVNGDDVVNICFCEPRAIF